MDADYCKIISGVFGLAGVAILSINFLTGLILLTGGGILWLFQKIGGKA